jgi:hypothetical protein
MKLWKGMSIVAIWICGTAAITFGVWHTNEPRCYWAFLILALVTVCIAETD